MKKIALIGCTGSIGKQVCAVVRRHSEEYSFSALAAGVDGEGLSALINEFHPEYAYLEKGTIRPADTTVVPREEKERLFEGCDVAFIAAGGFAGLEYTLLAAKSCKRIALANKESLVCGGELVMREVEKNGVDLVPVDSEHSALWQALAFRRDAPFSKLILTASGGPFRNYSQEELGRVTAKDALRHPTWNMGAKITVDSATLLNKGYEIIEAKWLYGAEFKQIETVVHPESIVHSLVCFQDGACLAQLGYPTMEVPIQLALTYPDRLPCAPQLDLIKIGALHFERLQTEKFPCFTLAVEAGKREGTAPTLLNAAGEEAVHAFLKGSISFPKIAETIQDVLDRIPSEKVVSFGQLKEADARGRRAATEILYGK